jgi:hypothetical protein
MKRSSAETAAVKAVPENGTIPPDLEYESLRAGSESELMAILESWGYESKSLSEQEQILRELKLEIEKPDETGEVDNSKRFLAEEVGKKLAKMEAVQIYFAKMEELKDKSK